MKKDPIVNKVQAVSFIYYRKHSNRIIDLKVIFEIIYAYCHKKNPGKNYLIAFIIRFNISEAASETMVPGPNTAATPESYSC